MKKTLIRNAQVVNEGRSFQADVLIEGERIARIAPEGIGSSDAQEIDASGLLLLPGAIDDQVHFREPGLTHKDDIAHGAAAAVAGGITSFMEMPNTDPQTLTIDLLEDKFRRAAATSVANHSFYMGISNGNLEEALRADPRTVCGLKAFLGSSTGDMLVDDEAVLDALFRKAHMLLAVHAESEPIIRANMAKAVERFGNDIPLEEHPLIRSAEACYASSSRAVRLAKEHGTRLHVLHISTAQELELFASGPIADKHITAEACVHHLWFTDADYAERGSRIKWNPAVKTAADRSAIRQAVAEGRIDVVATDHAPHTLEEKARPYAQCPSGAPLVQHALPAMLELADQGHFSVVTVVERMCHAPARLFNIVDRGFVREGAFADLVLVAPGSPWTATDGNVLYKCNWTPLNGTRFNNRVVRTFVNGHSVYADGKVIKERMGARLSFQR